MFRVDLRLRPASEVSPLAISVDGALTHYESSALAWERAAFISARAAAGDLEAGEGFLAAIPPFVWRRNLDFGAIGEIRRLTGRIREDHAGPREPGPGFDLKRGRGGIREVEFFAQTHQLIHGGRDPSLRERGTRAALERLTAAGYVDGELAASLARAYRFLRDVEHKIQIAHERQSQRIPEDADSYRVFVRRLGYVEPAGAATFEARLADETQLVHATFEALFHGAAEERRRDERPETSALLDDLADATTVQTRLAALGFRGRPRPRWPICVFCATARRMRRPATGGSARWPRSRRRS